jgi:hypothetical protein
MKGLGYSYWDVLKEGIHSQYILILYSARVAQIYINVAACAWNTGTATTSADRVSRSASFAASKFLQFVFSTDSVSRVSHHDLINRLLWRYF